MTDALKLTGSDLMRTLSGALASPAVDAAVRKRAEDVARTVRADAGAAARVVRLGAGDYAVSVAGPGQFAREFGSLDRPGDAAIARAVAGMKPTA